MAIRWPATELDPTMFPAWRDGIAAFEQAGEPEHAPRSYPGYRRWALPRSKRRWRSSLERALEARRSVRGFAAELPAAEAIARLCERAHGVSGEAGRGPVPSAGGLQALELYAIVRREGWLPRGAYHYDRAAHALSAIVQGAIDDALVPSLFGLETAPLVWVIAGDGARVAAKYGARGLRFLLLEAGHLMQNLCLVAVECGLATVPLGGVFERPLAGVLQLPPADEVLYAGACGRPA